jgi:pentatricopeptide repeat protein
MDHATLLENMCRNGNLQDAKELFNSIDGQITQSDLEFYINVAFYKCCANGHIEIMKWLYSLGSGVNKKVSIDIHDEYDSAFRLSCRHGHIGIAKWIYSLGDVNIHARHDDAIRCCCTNEQIEVVIFLLSIDDKYDYVHDEDNVVAKLLFDTGSKIKLSDKLTDKYLGMKQTMTSNISEYLIPDIADIVYYYV